MNASATPGLGRFDRVAVITDIHGNLPALEASFEAIEALDVDALICGGDLVRYGPHANEVCGGPRSWASRRSTATTTTPSRATSRTAAAPTSPSATASSVSAPSSGRSPTRTPARRRSCASWPFDLRFEVGPRRVRVAHGSPRKVNEYLFEDKPARLYERLAAQANCDVLVFGHTHKPWVHEYGGVLFVNCGSVGKPKDGDRRAAFALLEWTGGDLHASIGACPTTPTRWPARSAPSAFPPSTPSSSCSPPERRVMKYVLFVCNHNAGRSQMAQAFFERDAPDDLRAESAGSTPARAVWPEVVEVMREVDIDLSDRRPKRLGREMQLHADWAVTMACGDACPYVPTTVEDWDVPDPAGRPIEEVRAIRDAVEMRVRDLVEQRLDAIRADRTAHQVRLAHLLPALAEEFEGTRSPEEIRACADAVLSRFDDAPIRTHVLTLAHRRTCECLRRETCDAVAVG